MLDLFEPMNQLSAHVLVITGLVSWWTAWSLRKEWPAILAMRSTADLERQIVERTAELTRAIEDLEHAHADQAFLATIVESSQDAIVSKDLNGIITSWNSGAERLYGYSAPEAIGKTTAIVLPPGRDWETRAIQDRILHGERVIRYDSRRLSKDGRSIDISMTISPIKNSSGEIVGTSNIVHNITEKKAAEDVLRRAEEKLRSVWDNVVDGIIVFDKKGSIQSLNPAAERIFGYAGAEILGRDISVLMSESHRRQGEDDGFLTTDRRMSRRETIGIRRELEGRRSDGSIFPIDLAVSEFRIDGELNFTGIVRDVTERRDHEESLRQAKSKAEEASRAMSRFLANMSHEIRTPLTAVIGFAEVLQRGVADERESREYLETIVTSGRHLRTIIDDILDLSKIAADRMEYHRVRCSPHRVYSEVISILRVRAAEKGLSLEYHWTGRVPESILTDPDRLRQLLMNLIGNAIKFTDRGGVMVTASLACDAPDPKMILEVRDTGIGIAKEQLENIFSPFTQADGSISRRFGGTGLGLAIGRNIAQALGGDLTVESRPGEGSVFRAAIAAGPMEGVTCWDHPPDEALSSSGGVNESSPRLDGARILLVEDGATNRKLIGLLLRRAGAEVIFAEDGRVGVEAAAADRFDLILMDMQMPVLDGYQATRQIRMAGYDGPILALTAHALRGEAETSLEAGCDAHLTKPIDHEALLATIREHLPGGRFDQPRAAVSECGAPTLTLTSMLPMDDPEFREIVEEFLVTLAERLLAMRSAWEFDDRDALGRLAHWLKGAAGTVGFDAFTAPARQLEFYAKQGSQEDAGHVLREIEALAGRIVMPEVLSA